ncbi:hypothetical protein ACTFIW_007647 [Dictyostelium discoideum]
MATATLASLNAGIQGGGSLKNTFRNQINTDLFLDKNYKLIENFILCLQEIDRDFQDFKNYGNLKNKTSSGDKSKKENQLRIIYNNSNLEVIEEVIVDIGTRLQIVSFKLNDVYFVLINCHIPQKKLKLRTLEKFFILREMVINFHYHNIPFLIAGDINHNRTQIINLMGRHFYFANDKDIKTTTGGNSIDHIMYSYHNRLKNFQVFNDAAMSSENAKINHFALRSKFKLKKGINLLKGDIQYLYNNCSNQWKNLLNLQIISNKEIERPIEKQHCQQNKTKTIGDIPNDILVKLVIPKFTKENKGWNATRFHEKYLNGGCSYSTLLRFIKGESQNLSCKIALINYLNNF